jgi:NADH-quinone oxidoreductase subunit F
VPRASLVLAGADERDLTKLAEYHAIGGYEASVEARTMTPDAVLDELLTSNLRGRGGAGFPTGRKASLVDRKSGRPTYLVVNADESEPGAFKDREIMRRVPHRLIEGCLITAQAIESKHVFIYIRGEYLAEYEVLQGAVDEARAGGVLGDVDVLVHRGAGAYICGEETALLDSLEGRRGQPRPRPPFPPIQGLYAMPTQINNVQTIALVPKIIELGASEFARIGPENSPGTAVFSLSGNVVNPGNYELELGSTLRELIYDIGGGIAGGRELKAIIPGGSSVPVLTPDQLDTPMDYDSIGAVGSFFGSAAVMAIDDRCCMVQLALRAEKFYAHESCGKCTPCREGTRWLVQLLTKIEEGRAEHTDLALLESVCERMLGKSLCALGDFAVYPVASYLRNFRGEFEAHVEQGGCPFGGESSIEGIFAPIDQHAHYPTVEVPS